MDGIVLGPYLFGAFARGFARPAFTALLACAFASPAATALAAITCKPLLTIKNVREIRTSIMPQPWLWQATVVADTSFCATRSGGFEIDFIQIKEYAQDVQFTERYTWTTGQFDVTVILSADESIHDYRLGFIAPCVCRELPYEK
jgi:hypothetical protein